MNIFECTPSDFRATSQQVGSLTEKTACTNAGLGILETAREMLEIIHDRADNVELQHEIMTVLNPIRRYSHSVILGERPNNEEMSRSVVIKAARLIDTHKDCIEAHA